ncbi:MAG TPA: hypothetical protein EYP04_08575 [Anaerolineae bacterium]|nr:hypothetical protein [Anaerolineae bacterium]HIQ04314.1 hypothetical protein [Anaerolineae bacterium]
MDAIDIQMDAWCCSQPVGGACPERYDIDRDEDKETLPQVEITIWPVYMLATTAMRVTVTTSQLPPGN